MALENNDKINRVLGIYEKLMSDCMIYKWKEAQNYGVNERTIQRDIGDIRYYMKRRTKDIGIENFVIYDRIEKGYRLEQAEQLHFTNSEILEICKILLNSRAFTKIEMDSMLWKLIDCCVPKSNQKVVMDLIRNE